MISSEHRLPLPQRKAMDLIKSTRIDRIVVPKESALTTSGLEFTRRGAPQLLVDWLIDPRNISVARVA